MTRQEANTHILDLLEAEIEANPDLRFNQILVNQRYSKQQIVRDEIDDLYGTPGLVFNDLDYYEESEATLKRVLGE